MSKDFQVNFKPHMDYGVQSAVTSAIVRIDIPNFPPAAPDDPYFIDNFIRAMREVGIDPLKATRIPIMASMGNMFRTGELTKAEFQHACRNVLIMNPSIAKEG